MSVQTRGNQNVVFPLVRRRPPSRRAASEYRVSRHTSDGDPGTLVVGIDSPTMTAGTDDGHFGEPNVSFNPGLGYNTGFGYVNVPGAQRLIDEEIEIATPPQSPMLLQAVDATAAVQRSSLAQRRSVSSSGARSSSSSQTGELLYSTKVERAHPLPRVPPRSYFTPAV